MAELTIDLLLEDEKFKRELNNVVKRATDAGEKIGAGITTPVKTNFSQIANIAKGFVVGNLLLQLPGQISRAFSASIDAAQRQEDAINSLNSALRRSGELTRAISEDFQQFASDIQGQSIFGDEAILEQLAFAKALGLTNQQAKDVLTAAINLSAGIGIELNSAVRNIAKTFSGLQGELGEQLISLRQLTAEQLRAGEAVNLINREFSGAARDQLNTYSGSVKSLGNAFGDFTESLGQFITQSDSVKSTTKSLTEFFSELALRIKPTKSTADQVKILTLDIAELTEKLKDNQAFLANSKGIDSQVIAVRNTVKEQQRQLIDLQARLGVFKQELEQQDIFAPITESVKKNKSLTTQELLSLQNEIKFLGLSVSQQEQIRLDESVQKLKTANEQKLINDAQFFERRQQLEADFLLRQNERLAPLREAQGQFEEEQRQALLNGAFNFESFGEAATTVFDDIARSAKVTNKIVGQAIVNGIGGSVSQGFAAFGAALVNGENALEAFGKAFLQQIGQQAVALGTKFVLEGAAISFSPTSGGPAVGVPLIAKGAALAAFGGAISAFGGGGAGGGGADGSANPQSTFFQPDNDLRTDLVTEERLDPETRVSINIQGDVLDSEETGLRIAKILEEASLNNNVRVIGGLA